jgi:hypothetical protein
MLGEEREAVGYERREAFLFSLTPTNTLILHCSLSPSVPFCDGYLVIFPRERPFNQNYTSTTETESR